MLFLKKKTIKVCVSCVYFFLLLVANTIILNVRVLDARVFAKYYYVDTCMFLVKDLVVCDGIL